MGLTWQQDVLQAIGTSGTQTVNLTFDGPFPVATFARQRLSIHFVDFQTGAAPVQLLELQQRYAAVGFLLVQLWRDVWEDRPVQVVGRLQSLLGYDRRIHGRQTTARAFDAAGAARFLNEHHLQGNAGARYRFALFHEGSPVSVATFGPLRLMTSRGEGHLSAELIRFAHRSGSRVTGGLSKLLRHAVAELGAHDVMSYADRDWSLGQGYQKTGFLLAGETAPLYFALDAGRRVRPLETAGTRPHEVFNTGSLKYILHV
ncbi:hypothetical protein C7T94_09865 [Pedobacter yulinensis]|uniref:Uncharacterized protein n=1 Tax=Pedobacter yulinensis TaxID=2126353 RepID=A0A2T3HKE2_9SPHI|nr:hypothetical protein [Pedobacter yulinensis]PST82928.1 hypothetical protein C7T94_09865 [Pedobacter yulinensis]